MERMDDLSKIVQNLLGRQSISIIGKNDNTQTKNGGAASISVSLRPCNRLKKNRSLSIHTV